MKQMNANPLEMHILCQSFLKHSLQFTIYVTEIFVTFVFNEIDNSL